MNSDTNHNQQASTHQMNNPLSYSNHIYPEELLDESNGLGLREFITVLSQRKGVIITTAIFTMLAALLLSLLMKPVYRADATIKIERNVANANVEILNAEASRSDRDFFETQIQLLQTKTLARRVIDELKLDSMPAPQGLISKLKQILIPKNTDSINSKSTIEENFLKGLTVKPISNSQLLTINYDSSSAKQSAAISNAIAKIFVRQNLERRFDTAASYKAYVEENINVTLKSLEGAELRLNAYAHENNIIQDSDGLATGAHTLKKQLEELVTAEKETITANAKYQLYKDDPTNSPSSIINNPYILSLKKSAARLESKYQVLRNKRTRRAINLKKEVKGLRDQIATEITSIKSSIRTEYLEAQQKEKMLRQRIEERKDLALELQSKSTKFNRFQREVEINQLAYNKQLEELMAIKVASNVGTNNISIIDLANPPTKKHKPNLKLNLAFGLLLGLLLGMGIAFLREFIDDTIKNISTLERTSNLSVLAQLPDLRRLSRKKVALQTALEPRSSLAESVRSLRTSLRFSTRDGAPKSIFITSSGATEGKTTLAINLSIAYAQTGKKVLLIDADLRKPNIHKLLELNNDKGLTNFLASTETTNNNISQTTMIKQLSAITSGPIPSDPVELLSNDKLIDLLNFAKESFDHIIIDGPPVLGLADALLLANLTDATIVTVEAGKTKKANLQDSLQRLDRANSKVIGTVITRMNHKLNPAFNDQYYTYSQNS